MGENENIISQIVKVSEICDQNGECLSKNHKSFHICSILQLKKDFIG